MSYQTEDTSAVMGGEPLPVPPEAPMADQTRAKKKLNYAFFIILLAIASLAGFAAFLSMCMSFSQMSSDTVMPNGTSIFLPGKSCSDIKAFLPLRWKMAALHQLMMQCPWRSGNSAFRVFMSLVGLASIGLFAFSLIKSQITWSKWAFFGSAGFMTLMYFIIMIVDGSALSKAKGYCSSGMPDAPFQPGLLVGRDYGIECFPGPFTGMVFSDVLTFLCFPALAGYYFYYNRRARLNGKPTLPTDDESERQPLASNAAPVPRTAAAPKKHVYTASAIEDESLAQDVTGANPFDPRTGLADPSTTA